MGWALLIDGQDRLSFKVAGSSGDRQVVIGRPLDMKGRPAYTEAELIEQCRAADVALVSHLERVTPAVMEHAEHLGLVIVPFIGVDKIDVPAATRLGVLVANSPTKENFIAVAEATIGLILVLLKRIRRGEARLRAGEWARREDRGDFLFGKTVGIVGLGRIGTHVARRLASWDVRLVAATNVDLPRAIAEGRARGLTGSGPFRYGWFARSLAWSMEPPPRFTMKSPKIFRTAPAERAIEPTEERVAEMLRKAGPSKETPKTPETVQTALSRSH